MAIRMARTAQLHAAEAAEEKARQKQHQRMDAASATDRGAEALDSDTHPPKEAEKPAVGKRDRVGEDDMEASK